MVKHKANVAPYATREVELAAAPRATTNASRSVYIFFTVGAIFLVNNGPKIVKELRIEN